MLPPAIPCNVWPARRRVKFCAMAANMTPAEKNVIANMIMWIRSDT